MNLFRSLLLLTVDELGYFHQVGHHSLICMFYDQPTGFGAADFSILYKFRDAFGCTSCNYVTPGTKSIIDAVPLFRVLGKYLRIDHYNILNIVTKQQEPYST